jgi:hypothetical protein
MPRQPKNVMESVCVKFAPVVIVISNREGPLSGETIEILRIDLVS